MTGRIDAAGSYKGRTIIRTKENTVNLGLSLGHYVFGDGIALNPNDVGYDVDLFYHEFSHTFQSRIMGPLYLTRIGISSALYQGSTEDDANWRSEKNFGVLPWNLTAKSNKLKWWESAFTPVLWPYVWIWNK